MHTELERGSLVGNVYLGDRDEEGTITLRWSQRDWQKGVRIAFNGGCSYWRSSSATTVSVS
jgi:hypothetical protein